MDNVTISAGWLTLRRFTAADVPWVFEVAQDSALRQFVELPSPYLMEHARFFVVAAEARGRGVAPQAVRAICRWAFAARQLDLIEWRAEVGNHASRRVAQKAGFLMEGQLRRRLVHRGERVDAWVGSLLKTEVEADTE